MTQSNLAITYSRLGRIEEAARIEDEVYSEHVRFFGEENRNTLVAASNYASSLIRLQRFEEAKPLLRRTMPMTRRVFGENHEFTLKIRWCLAVALYKDPGATLGDLRKAVATFEEIEPIARRVLGSAHPDATAIEFHLENSRTTLSDRERA